MALRKFIFINSSEGYVEEQQAADELSLGKVTLSGVSGIALDGGGQRAANFADPTTAGDLTTKSYVDAIVAGFGDFKDSVRVATTVNLAATRVGNVLTADANGALSVDGVSPAVGNRVLVKNQTTGADNGIYTVTATGDGSNPFVLTRATDADASTEVTAGMYVFVTEGTTQEDTAWILATNDTITLNTTSLSFVQFSALKDLIAGAGLLKTGNTVEVELATNPALEFDAVGVGGKLQVKVDGTRGTARDANGLYVKIDTTKAIEFDGDGELSVKVDGTKGIEISGGSLAVKVDTTKAIAFDGEGELSVKVDTARGVVIDGQGELNANIDEDSLLFDSTQTNKIAAKYSRAVRSYADFIAATGGVTTLKPVTVTATATEIKHADYSADADAKVVGIAAETKAAGQSVKVYHHGLVPGALTGATPGATYYLGASGAIIDFASIGSAKRIIRLGWAVSATDLWLDIQDLGKKA